MKALDQCRLYAFLDTAYLKDRPIEQLASALCEGGADMIQLRAKDHPLQAVRQLAEKALAITRPAGVPLVINDHPQLALELGAEFVHLGQEDFFQNGHLTLETLFPEPGHPLVGLSSHAPEQALQAVYAGAHYLGVGPVYPTQTKPQTQAVTLDYVRWAAKNIAIPWFAIGGITLNNIPQVLEAGATRIAVVSAILSHPNPAEACRHFKSKLPPLP